MIFPLISLLGGLYLITREQEKPIGPQPTFPPELVEQLCGKPRGLEGGGTARYFKQEVSDAVVQALANHVLHPVGTEGLPQGAVPPGHLFRIMPATAGAAYGAEQSAQQAVMTMQRMGFIVLGTLTCAMLSGPDDKLVMVCEQSSRKLASQGSQWAILLDAAGAPKVAEAEAAPAGPVVPAPFDANLPTDVVVDLANLVSKPETTAGEILAAANELDEATYPLTVAYLRGRATSLELRDRVRRAAGIHPPVQVVEARTEVAQPGAGEGAVVIGSVMGDAPSKKASKKEAPPNGAAQA